MQVLFVTHRLLKSECSTDWCLFRGVIKIRFAVTLAVLEFLFKGGPLWKWDQGKISRSLLTSDSIGMRLWCNHCLQNKIFFQTGIRVICQFNQRQKRPANFDIDIIIFTTVLILITSFLFDYSIRIGHIYQQRSNLPNWVLVNIDYQTHLILRGRYSKWTFSCGLDPIDKFELSQNNTFNPTFCYFLVFCSVNSALPIPIVLISNLHILGVSDLLPTLKNLSGRFCYIHRNDLKRE